MKAAVLTAPRKMEIQEREKPASKAALKIVKRRGRVVIVSHPRKFLSVDIMALWTWRLK